MEAVTTVNANSFPDLPPLKTEVLEAWIETFTGKKFHFLNPADDEIDIEDIAHALANECRFGGHTNRFYSVAEHSVLVATLLPDTKALGGLLHDASEAYLRDIPSSIKQYLNNYKELESNVQDAIWRKFEVSPSLGEIKEADTLALKAEARLLLPSKGESWLHHYPTKDENIWKQITVHCLPPEGAKKLFLDVFNYLTGKTNTIWAPPETQKIILAR